MSRVNVRDILEILCQYNVRQTSRINFLGDCSFERSEIRINPKQTLTQRVDTLVHEALHAYYDDRGINASEQRVRKETKQVMRRLYGKNYGK